MDGSTTGSKKESKTAKVKSFKTWNIYIIKPRIFTDSSLSALFFAQLKSKKISNDQELIQSDPTSCPQNQKGNN